MMNLYFVDKDSNQHLVAEDVTEENAWEYAEADLAERRPGFVSYYTRRWYDDFFRHWIDYGSHTEFYILQKPEQALNVVIDAQEDDKNKPKGPACTKDYCDI